MPHQEQFTPPRNRDAFAAIRGFVYQVDLTIVRWLNLLPEEVLEPECGEDIDLVATTLESGGPKASRLLEQVGHLDKNVTLNTPKILSALTGFFEHAAHNPNASLLFRFFTNAHPAQESPNLFRPRARGLDVWAAIVAHPSPIVHGQLRHLRRTLKEATRPKSISHPRWTAFRGFVANTSDDLLQRFVQSVEFSCANANAQSLSLEVQSLLQRKGYAQSPSHASGSYSRLFLHVFKLLATSGLKQLRIADAQLVLGTTPDISDERGASTVDWMLRSVLALGPQLIKIQQGVAEAEARMDVLQSDIRLSDAFTAEMSAPPPAPSVVAPRNDARAALQSALAATQWLAISGSPGLGKTQLVRLLAGDYKVLWWLRLRDLDSRRAASSLTLAMSSEAEAHAGSLVVLDDLPFVQPGSALSGQLSLLLKYCQQRRAKLMTTSEHPFSQATLLDWPHGALRQAVAAPYSDDDIAHLLQEHGAPELLRRPEWIQTAAALTGRHPILVSALIGFLRDRAWAAGNETLQALFSGDYSRPIAPDVSRRLLQSVPDADTRSLLYRVKLALGSISQRAALILAEVAPSVPEPASRLALLDGVWMQREGTEEWSISPLLRILPAEDLPEALRADCYSVLADQTLASTPIHYSRIPAGLHYLSSSGRHDDFARFLGNSLTQVLRSSSARVKEALQYLCIVTIPKSVAPTMRVRLAALQVACLTADTSPSVLDSQLDVFDSHLNTTTERSDTIIQAVSLVFSRARGIRGLRYISMLLEGRNDLPARSQESLTVEALLRIGVVYARDTPSTFSWLSLFDVVTTDDKRDFEHSADGPSVAATVCNGAYLREHDKPEAERDWPAVITTLEQIQERGRLLDLPIVEAFAARAKAIVIGETLGRPDDASAFLAAQSARHKPGSREMFALNSKRGEHLWVAHRERESMDAFALALACDLRGLAEEGVWAALRGARSSAAAGVHSEALRLALWAVDLSDDREVEVLSRARAFLEAAMAHWALDERRRATLLFCRGVDVLLSTPDEDRDADWQHVLVWLTHAAAFMESLVVRGVEPETTALGTPYLKPFVGMFTGFDVGASAAGNRDRTVAAVALVVSLSHAVGEYRMAREYARRATEMLFSAGDIARVPLVVAAGPYLAADGAFEDLIEACWTSGRVTHARAEAPAVAIPGGWSRSAFDALFFGVLPITFQLLKSGVVDARAGIAKIDRALDKVGAERGPASPWDRFLGAARAVLGDTPFNEAVGLANQLKGPNEDFLRYCCYVLASLHPLGDARMAAKAQSESVQAIAETLRAMPVAVDLLLVPALEDFWMAAFTQHRFQFQRPFDTERELIGRLLLPRGPRRMKSILSLLWERAGTIPTGTAATWLASDE